MGALLFLVPSLSAEMHADVGGFDLQEATRFAWLSRLAYCGDSQDMRQWSCKGCKASKISAVPGSVYLKDGGLGKTAQVMYGRLADQPGCFISWRGSSDTMNWIRDFEF